MFPKCRMGSWAREEARLFDIDFYGVDLFRISEGPAVEDLHVTASKSFWQVQATPMLYLLVCLTWLMLWDALP